MNAASQDRSKLRRFLSLMANRFSRWYWPFIQPPISWIFFKFLSNEQGLNRFLMGCREFCWTFMCGHGVAYGLHVANIWWGIHLLPVKKDENNIK